MPVLELGSERRRVAAWFLVVGAAAALASMGYDAATGRPVNPLAVGALVVLVAGVLADLYRERTPLVSWLGRVSGALLALLLLALLADVAGLVPR
ncbi:MAG: hypothetical protein ABEJ70_02390 [Halobacteriaceae archaeon]